MNRRYRKMREILDGALALPEEERRDFAREACGEDDGLWQEVARLIDAPLDRLGALIDNIESGDILTDTSQAQTVPGIDDRVGPFELIRELGRGGAGVVYLGRQTEPVARDVAVKVLSARPGRQVFERRFEAEQRVLAHLHHPHLAALYDAGITEDGHPWFAMELVDGVPLTEYVHAHSPGFRPRINIIQDVCSAVAYAHRKGILHRDLKPSNILISDESGKPLPKIIDFGIARVMDGSELELSLQTMAGETLGTPLYMSPEQARGDVDGVDLRSDVFSLGVILHEVLTGRNLYEGNTDSLYGMIRNVADGRLTITTQLWDGTPMPADLRSILAVCLDPEPDRRYAGPGELADDLERLLDQRPVNAHPPTTMYQLKKTVRRHPVVSLLVVALAVLLTGFSITMAFLYAGQQKAREAAQLEAEKAGEVSGFLVELLRSARSDKSGPNVTVREALESGQTRVMSELDDQPEVQVAVLEAISQAYISLERYEAAEACLTSGLEIQATQNLPPAARQILLNGLVTVYYYTGRYEKATVIARRLVDSRMAADPHQRELGPSLNNLGRLLQHEWRFDDAERVLRQAVRHYEETGNTRWETNYLVAVGNLGGLLRETGQYEEAIEHSRWEIEGRIDQLGADNTWTLASTLGLVEALTLAGRWAESDSLARFTRSRIGPDINFLLAEYHYQLGLLTHDMGRLDEAADQLEEALTIRSSSIGEDSPRLIPLKLRLAEVYRNQGLLDAAEQLNRDVVADQERATGPEHPSLALALTGLGATLAVGGEPVEAEVHLRRALALYESRGLSNTWQAVDPHLWLAHVLARTERPGAARNHLEKYVRGLPLLPAGARRRGARSALELCRSLEAPDLGALIRGNL